jgi:hypothetical protein
MSALNHNQGKPKWSLLLTDFADELREVLRVREVIESTGKYDRMNFAQSQGKPEAKVFLEDNLDSIERHLFDRRANKHTDQETQCFHMAHICVRALMDLSYALREPKQGDLANYRTKKTYQIVDFVKNGSFRCDNCDRQTRCYEDFGEGGVDCKLTSTQIYKETSNMTLLEGSESEDPMSNCDNFDFGEVVKKSRYPWKDAPSYAKYAAIDRDGTGRWYLICPQVDQTRFFGAGEFIGKSMLRDGEDWITTLEMRPKC